jgi:hypothetical protein
VSPHISPAAPQTSNAVSRHKLSARYAWVVECGATSSRFRREVRGFNKSVCRCAMVPFVYTMICRWSERAISRTKRRCNLTIVGLSFSASPWLRSCSRAHGVRF